MTQAEKQAKALENAKASGDHVRIELDGVLVARITKDGHVEVPSSSDAGLLRGAAEVVGGALSEMVEGQGKLAQRITMLTLLLGALVSRFAGAASAVQEQLKEAPESFSFAQAAPKGKAS